MHGRGNLLNPYSEHGTAELKPRIKFSDKGKDDAFRWYEILEDAFGDD